MLTLPLTLLNQRTCKYYFSESDSHFQLSKVASHTKIQIENPDFNHVVIILEGKALIEYDNFTGKIFDQGEIVFIPAHTKLHIQSLKNSKILTGTFDMPLDICTSQAMDSLSELQAKTTYSFDSVKIVLPMKQFLDILVLYLKNDVKCGHLHSLKQKEFFLLFRWFYSPEDFVKLFYPIIGKELSFRTKVQKNYDKAENVAELATLLEINRSNFDAKFKKVFELTPKQWVLKRKAQHIRFFMSEPNITISDILIRFDFDSFAQSNRFCKQQFGATYSLRTNKKNINYYMSIPKSVKK